MRVLHIGKFYPPFAGGIENFLADLLPALQQQGVTVAALVHEVSQSFADPTAFAQREHAPQERGVSVYRVPCYGRLLYSPISPTFPFWFQRILRTFQPDLLHFHLPNTSAFWALAIPTARRIPWVIHWHADVVASALDRRLALAYRFYRPFEQRLLSASSAIIVTSQPYLEASTALVPWRDRCCVIPLGLNPMRIPEPDGTIRQWAVNLWGTNAFRILAIGRLTYYKGHDVLIQATARLPGSRVLIVGTGEHRQRLSTLIHTLRLQERVQLVGFQSEAHLHALLASCDVLCLPSLERTEAFGLVLLEAMCFSKPVVVSDIPGSGPGWVVRQAGHGLSVPVGDAEALAAVLQELQHDPLRRAALGQAGQRALQERFGMGPVATATYDLYRRLMKSFGTSPTRNANL